MNGSFDRALAVLLERTRQMPDADAAAQIFLTGFLKMIEHIKLRGRYPGDAMDDLISTTRRRMVEIAQAIGQHDGHKQA